MTGMRGLACPDEAHRGEGGVVGGQFHPTLHLERGEPERLCPRRRMVEKPAGETLLAVPGIDSKLADAEPAGHRRQHDAGEREAEFIEHPDLGLARMGGQCGFGQPVDG